VQQRAAPGLVQRAINVEDFEGGNFTMDVLETYLAKFGPGKIEDHNDSDDKARTIVALWRKGKIKLDARKKILLIQEMQSGFTGDDDERAILTLLLNTTDGPSKNATRPPSGDTRSDHAAGASWTVVPTGNSTVQGLPPPASRITASMSVPGIQSASTTPVSRSRRARPSIGIRANVRTPNAWARF